MYFWNLLKSLWVYMTFSDTGFSKETLVCPRRETLGKKESEKDLNDYFVSIIDKKQKHQVEHEFNAQDVFLKEGEPETMIYTQVVLEEGIDQDLRVMKLHKKFSQLQDPNRMYVTEFKETYCVQLEDDIYFFMNEETKCDGTFQRAFFNNKELLEDFNNVLLRLDFYNRILDKFQAFLSSGFKFDKLFKGQILYRTLEVKGNLPRAYEPLFDIYYFISKFNPTSSEEIDSTSQRFDFLLMTLLIFNIEIDYYFSSKGIFEPKDFVIPEDIFSAVEFPKVPTKVTDKEQRSFPAIFLLISSAFDITVTIQDSPGQLVLIRDFLDYLNKVLMLMNKNTSGVSPELKKGYGRFFGRIVEACHNDENILKNPNMDLLINSNLELLEEMNDHGKQHEMVQLV